MNDQEIIDRERAHEAIRKMEGMHGKNVPDYTFRVAMCVLELARQEWKPPHPDIIAARDIYYQLGGQSPDQGPVDVATGRYDGTPLMRAILKGIEAGREMEYKERGWD